MGVLRLAVAVTVCIGVFLVDVSGSDFAGAKRWTRGLKAGTRVAWDDAGNAVAVDLGHGRLVRNHYDQEGRLVSQVSPEGHLVSYERSSDGRIERVRQFGIETRLVRDVAGSIVGEVSGASAADRQRALRALGIAGEGKAEAREVSYDSSGRAGSTPLLQLDVLYHYGSSDTSLRRELRSDQWSYAITTRSLHDGSVEVADSNTAFRLVKRQGVGLLLDSSGREVARSAYDSAGRVLRTTISGGLYIQYHYDFYGEWVRKTLGLPNGMVLHEFSRNAAYADPDVASGGRGRLRAATGDVSAVYDDGDLHYLVSSIVRPRLDSAGQLKFYSYSVPSRSAFSADEIRLYPDGSIEVFPDLPHAEGTIAARSVRPHMFRIPVGWRSVPTLEPTSEREPRDKKNGRRATGGRELRASGWDMAYYCQYEVPAGSVEVGGVTTVYAGEWQCGYYPYYYEDVSEPTDPAGIGGGFALPDPYEIPLTRALQEKVDQARPIANDKLCNVSACADLFSGLSRPDGAAVLAATTYLSGENTSECNDNPGWGGWTRTGSLTVYLCTGFAQLSGEGAAKLLIHEGLHSAGLDEYPSDPTGFTSDEINQMIEANCNLPW